MSLISKRKVIFNLIFILLIGLSFRIYGLAKYDFWHDEIIMLAAAKDCTPSVILDYIIFPNRPFHQTFFYFLLKFWMLLGKSEFILRLLPLIFGFLSIITIFFVGKVLFDRKTGLIGAFFLAFSPFHIYYSQELVPYTLFCFLSLVSIYFSIKALKEDK
ncbi:MAG: glycosyltransferase family 39 protein, partial [Candidatus Omnitrophica bacterium]|nr:glycosyltransferase family 39 protein [Candidatus Omnitrophota bacterium]